MAATDGRVSRWSEAMHRWRGRAVLVIGDLMLDEYLWGAVSRISPEAPVPVVDISEQSFRPGGAANVANNVAALGGSADLVGVVGNDIMGNTLLSTLRSKGIGCDGIVHDDERPTTVKTRVIAGHQQVVRTDREKRGPIHAEQTEAIARYAESRMSELSAIVIEDYDKGVVTGKLIERVVAAARKRKVPILVDPKVEHLMDYKNVTLLKPNRRETEGALGSVLSDADAVQKAGERLLKMLKCEAVLVTNGERGMTLVQVDGKRTKTTHVPAHSKEVYDVTGAGDTVIAVVALAHSAGVSFEDGAWIASYAAAVKCEKLGAVPVSVDEIRQAMEERGPRG